MQLTEDGIVQRLPPWVVLKPNVGRIERIGDICVIRCCQRVLEGQSLFAIRQKALNGQSMKLI
jgi:hypothetical protein